MPNSTHSKIEKGQDESTINASALRPNNNNKHNNNNNNNLSGAELRIKGQRRISDT
jgi:hypothetical protein